MNKDLNPAFGGGRWYPLTVRRILQNESYTGNTVYRRTKVVSYRDQRTGKNRRRVQLRDEKDWITIPDATPKIIDQAVFERAREILEDPARRLIGQPSRSYRLRGHIRCMAYGSPMVGQALLRGIFP